MSHLDFTLLLTAYVILVALDYVAGALPIHPDRIRVNAVKEYLSNKSFVFVTTYSIISVFFILLFLIGLIGLYFLWAPSPYIWIIGFIGKFADSVIIPVKNEKNFWERLLGELQFLMEGFLIAVIFFGPARTLFH